MYDPSIGRFHVPDRFAEKYYNISPYAYCANNPIKFIDVNDDSIWFSIDNNVATLNFTAKMINMSNDNINMGAAIKDITSSINKAFKGASLTIDGKEYALNVNAQITSVSSMADVADSDHLFVMANGPDVAYGITNELGGKVTHLNASYFHNEGILSSIFGISNKARTGAHEFGHMLGLDHPAPRSFGYNAATDIMVQGGEGGTFSPGNVIGAYRNWRGGNLNKGSNSDYTKDGIKLPAQNIHYKGKTGTIGSFKFWYKNK